MRYRVLLLVILVCFSFSIGLVIGLLGANPFDLFKIEKGYSLFGVLSRSPPEKLAQYTASGKLSSKITDSPTYKYFIKGLLKFNPTDIISKGYRFFGRLDVRIPAGVSHNVLVFGELSVGITGAKIYGYTLFGTLSTIVPQALSNNYGLQGLISIYSKETQFNITSFEIYSHVGKGVWVIGRSCTLEIHVTDPWGWIWVDRLTIVFNNTAVYEFYRTRLLSSSDPNNWLEFKGIEFSGTSYEAIYKVYFEPTENLHSILIAVVEVRDEIGNLVDTDSTIINVLHEEAGAGIGVGTAGHSLGGEILRYENSIILIVIYIIISLMIVVIHKITLKYKLTK